MPSKYKSSLEEGTIILGLRESQKYEQLAYEQAHLEIRHQKPDLAEIQLQWLQVSFIIYILILNSKPNRLNLLEFPLCTKVSHILPRFKNLIDLDDEMVKINMQMTDNIPKMGKRL